ncbi:MAG: hypothetical protein ACYC27_13145 [Armatimonadota bacterium]
MRFSFLAIPVILALSAITMVDAAPVIDKTKTTLVFSLDQGFGNGVVIQNDQVAIRRIVMAVKPLRKHYNVCMLLNPQTANKKYLTNTLDTLVKYQMPFVLDVYTSDSYTLGSCTTHNAPFDCTHALSISMDELSKLKVKYGKCLAGLRFMEVFGQDFTVRAIKTTNPEWARPAEKLPEDNVFQVKYAEQFIKFAKENGMFLQWADFHWYGAASWDAPQKVYDEQVSELLRKYPGVVTVTYNNNEPNEDSVKKIDSWHKYVEGFVKDGAAGYGLSDQSWLRKDHFACPPEDIIKWADSALSHRCKLIQFEPVWYFFKLPLGSFELNDYKSDPKWADRGGPTKNLKLLSDFLLNKFTK